MIWTPYGIDSLCRRKQIPSGESLSKSEVILSQIIENSGLAPSVYRTSKGLDYGALKFVHTRLCEILEDEIAKFELVDACKKLYEVHEKFMARNEILAGQKAVEIQSVRSLLELAVKCCDESGVPLDEEGRDYLLALGFQAVCWDYVWDQFSLGFFGQELVISQSYEFRPQRIDAKYHKAQREHTKYIATRKRLMESSQDQGLILPNGGHFHRESLSTWLRNESPHFPELDSRLSSEVGYSLIDYLLLRNALVKFAVDAEPHIVEVSTQVVSGRVGFFGVEESAIFAILKDFALSREVVCDVPSAKIFSVGRRNRDSRFIRRPILLVTDNDDTVLLFGLTSLSEASDLFLRQVNSGSIPVTRWQENSEVERVFGKIQGARGDPFKNAIAKDCERVQGIDHVVVEKDSISGVKSDPDLGAIDIFLVDNARQRFILVEVKNSGNRAGVPLTMADEYRTFSEEYLSTLKAKAEWFRSHISELKKEFRIPAEEDYKVEEVLVVNQQRLWVMMHESRLPILDDDDFMARLGTGRDLLSNIDGIRD